MTSYSLRVLNLVGMDLGIGFVFIDCGVDEGYPVMLCEYTNVKIKLFIYNYALAKLNTQPRTMNDYSVHYVSFHSRQVFEFIP